jgi:ribosomal protein S18 acetylase RimI-like enzyme
MTWQLVQETEHRLLEPICEFRRSESYTVFKSVKFPNYWGGNGLKLLRSENRSLDDWESTFNEHFDSSVFRHKTFTFYETDEFEHLKDQATSKNYNVEITTSMLVTDDRQSEPLSADFEIHVVATEEDWSRLRIFYDETSKNEDWYDPTVGTRELFDKIRHTSDAIGIDWFYISQTGCNEVLAKAGIFRYGDICRLQDVTTAKPWRRKKLASMLVSFLIRRALKDTKGLACVAVADYYAINLYRKLGFQECGNSVCLMKYPPRLDSNAN